MHFACVSLRVFYAEKFTSGESFDEVRVPATMLHGVPFGPSALSESAKSAEWGRVARCTARAVDVGIGNKGRAWLSKISTLRVYSSTKNWRTEMKQKRVSWEFHAAYVRAGCVCYCHDTCSRVPLCRVAYATRCYTKISEYSSIRKEGVCRRLLPCSFVRTAHEKCSRQLPRNLCLM